MDPMVQMQLYVELLNHYVYFLEKGNDQVTVTIINQILQKIREELPNLEKSEESEQINKHFLNTIAHIKSKIRSSDDKNMYEGIEDIDASEEVNHVK